MTTTPTIWIDRSTPNFTLSGPGGNDQTNARGIGLSNGNFLVVWETNIFASITGAPYIEIWGEIFNPVGVSIGGEFQLAGFPGTAGFAPDLDFRAPEIVAADDGGFHLAYVTDANSATDIADIRYSRFDENGLRVLDKDFAAYPFSGDNTTSDSIAIALAENGLPILSTTVEFPTIDFNLATLVRSIFINGMGSSWSADQYWISYTFPAIDGPEFDGTAFGEADSLGNAYFIVDEEVQESPPATEVLSIIQAADERAVFGDRVLEPLYSGSGHVMAVETDNIGGGSFGTDDRSIIVTDTGGRSVYTTSTTAGTYEYDPDIAALRPRNGGTVDYHVLVYQQEYAATGNTQISGSLKGGGNSTDFTLGSLATGHERNPKVVALNDGGFIVGWIEGDDVWLNTQIRLQRFDAFASKVGSEISFPNTQGSEFYDFDLEALHNGRILVTATVAGADIALGTAAANYGVRYAVYDVGDSIFTGDDNPNVLTADPGGSRLEGLGGDDSLYGLGGDDHLIGGTGTDFFDGGAGSDTVDFSYSQADWTVDLATDTAMAGSTVETILAIENVITGAGDDTINTDEGATNVSNTVRSGGGDDTIIASLGRDYFDGGTGIDTVDFSQVNWGAATGSHSRVYDLQNEVFTRVDTITQQTVDLDNIENVIGSNFDETFIADLAPNIFTGNGGTNTFVAFAGGSIAVSFLVDTFIGGPDQDNADFSAIALAPGDVSSDRDYVFALTGGAVLAGGSATLDGNLMVTLVEIENVRGTAYDDVITGNALGNRLIGMGGDDVISDGGGDDSVSGNLGNDTFIAGSGANTYDGGDGDDTLDYSGFSAGIAVNLLFNTATGGQTGNPAENDTISSIENLIGTSGADVIAGTDGSNRLNGGSGIDVLYGDGGNDTIWVDNAADIILELPGDGERDRVATSVSYTLGAGVEVEWFTTTSKGGTTALDLTGNALYQEIVGNAGANTLSTGTGAADLLRGLGGDDTYRVYNAADTVRENAGEGYDAVRAAVDFALGAGEEIEELSTNGSTGTSSIDLTGNELAQEIIGNAGANILHTGGGAADVLKGLGGDDTYRIFNSADTVFEVAGNGTDRVMAAVTFALAAGQEIEVLTTNGSVGTAAINLTGNALFQEITGNAGANILSDGGAGASDTLKGLGGDDTYIVYNAGAVIVETGGNGVDKLAAGVSFTLAADDDIETMTTTSSGGTTAIDLTGNALAQTIVGNAGANTLHTGGGAADILRGLGGDDVYRVFNSADEVVETAGAGYDRVTAAVSYALGAGDEIEYFTTNGSTGVANLDLSGNEFDQEIVGNAGANRIDGGAGADLLRGLAGNDTFVFSTALAPANIDEIGDFDPAADQIELAQSVFSGVVQAPGAMLSGYFKANATGTATDANDRVIYDTDDGLLFYDADGNGAGATVQFAILTGAPVITFSDFVIA